MEGSTVSKLDVIRVDYQQRYVLGRFQRYPDSNSAIVYFSKNLNTCWSRYIAAKEMSHVILDRTNESMITNISTIVDWMLNGLEAGSNDALISESAAAQFAAELLVPYDHSQHLLKDASKSSYEIAAIFSVPERIIDILRLPGYIVRRDEAYADL
jgi:Zn-dependent peptidase ImmA (M78 family)